MGTKAMAISNKKLQKIMPFGSTVNIFKNENNNNINTFSNEQLNNDDNDNINNNTPVE